jgi:hypothetical protein
VQRPEFKPQSHQKKKNQSKKGLGMAQAVEHASPEFKSQYCQMQTHPQKYIHIYMIDFKKISIICQVKLEELIFLLRLPTSHKQLAVLKQQKSKQ